ncbi:SRPBCC family protein [Verrucosispora sp. WMMD573]|uniref:SRPBCC family protein n=1 Tax=Verrucosispora sp. WMMD573 TaxID=3015149 RepID=UPI00248D39F6|nr:SRPBCC family protein [Verrucosispora sp. WMMD573]WBB53786.1 SRPBCC family protein [Verrucosispora sp. WMMD573]
MTQPPAVTAQMLIRKPAAEVFQAFADPAVTTKFWFTESSGRLEPGATVTWTWGMYGVSTVVTVKEVEENSRILAEWDSESPTQLEWRFLPGEGDTTLVRVTETGFTGTADEAVAKAIDSMGGFTMVLCACKALLEQGVLLNAVGDAHPTGFED